MRTDILLVSSNQKWMQELNGLLYGVKVESVISGIQALQVLRRNPSLLILDLHLSDIDGIVLLSRIRELKPQLPIIAITHCPSFDEALLAMKMGASCVVSDPNRLPYIKDLTEKLLKGANPKISLDTNIKNRERISFNGILGQSDQIVQLFEIVDKVADTDATVLILGESGTGKELFARALHDNSHRRNKLFVPVNCGAIPEDLLESELFGHSKGAFTGAVGEREGRFSLAQGGTIFLDEIGDLPFKLQVKLLRVIQERKFEKVGSSKTISADIRIIAATNNDLEEKVKNKQFREDLFYRLNVLPLLIPPLRDRIGDINLLVNAFIEKNNKEKHRNITGVQASVWEVFQRYTWPGNVRELENLIERLVILKGSGELELADLPPRLLSAERSNVNQLINPSLLNNVDVSSNVDFYKEVENFENSMIMRALECTGWNKNKAARMLNLNRTTLVEKIKRRNLYDSLPESVRHTF